MSGFMSEIIKHTPQLLFKLLQRRLLDKNAEITQEEYKAAWQEFEDEIVYVKARLEVLDSHQKILKALMDKDDLMHKEY